MGPANADSKFRWLGSDHLQGITLHVPDALRPNNPLGFEYVRGRLGAM